MKKNSLLSLFNAKNLSSANNLEFRAASDIMLNNISIANRSDSTDSVLTNSLTKEKVDELIKIWNDTVVSVWTNALDSSLIAITLINYLKEGIPAIINFNNIPEIKNNPDLNAKINEEITYINDIIAKGKLEGFEHLDILTKLNQYDKDIIAALNKMKENLSGSTTGGSTTGGSTSSNSGSTGGSSNPGSNGGSTATQVDMSAEDFIQLSKDVLAAGPILTEIAQILSKYIPN